MKFNYLLTLCCALIAATTLNACKMCDHYRQNNMMQEDTFPSKRKVQPLVQRVPLAEQPKTFAQIAEDAFEAQEYSPED